MTAPSTPARGGAAPRVSDTQIEEIVGELKGGSEPLGSDLYNALTDLRDARAEITDLRAKLKAAEDERDRAWESMQSYARQAGQAYADVEAAESALSDLRATLPDVWRAGRDAGARAARCWNACEDVVIAAIRAVKPPAEYGAKEEA